MVGGGAGAIGKTLNSGVRKQHKLTTEKKKEDAILRRIATQIYSSLVV